MKKYLSLILSVLMIMSVFTCVPVSAVEEETTSVVTPDEPIEVPGESDPTYDTFLTVKSTMEGEVLTWTCDGEADSYDVYRRDAGAKEAVLLANVTELTYTDTNVKNNTYYNYHIVAVKEGVETAPSEVVLTRHFDAPAKVSVTNGVKFVNITWTSVEGALSYDVYVRGAGQTEYTLVVSGVKGNGPVYHAEVKTGSYYRYAVVARCGKYQGALNTNGPVLKAVKTPTLISATNQKDGVLFKWNKVDGATGYRVYRRAGGEKNFKYLGTVTTTTFTDATAVSGKYYKYVVRAVHGSTYSNFDANGKVLKYVQAPKLLGIANGTDGIYVKWQLVGGADKYAIYRRGAGEGYKLLKVVNASAGNKYKDTTAVACQYYRYTVRAISGGVYSGYDSNGLVLRFMPLNGTWNKAVTYNFYKYAVGKVKNDGAAGYSLKIWQDVNKLTVKSPDAAVSNALKQSFTDSFSEVYNVQCAKGSSDAMECFPANTVAYNQVKSATCTKKGNNYVIKIVFVDTKNPADGGNNPISKSAPMYFDVNSMKESLVDSGSCSSASASALYTAYTITSEINAAGQFVSMTHSGPCTMSLDMNIVDFGKVDMDCKVNLNARYSGFSY